MGNSKEDRNLSEDRLWEEIMVWCTATNTANLMLDSLELENETEILVKVIYLGSALRKKGRKSGEGRKWKLSMWF